MNTYFALFRGINVGGRSILPMKDLVAILEGRGYEKARNYIQSGNVVFQSKDKQVNKVAGKISAAILKSHGFEPKVLLLGISDCKTRLIIAGSLLRMARPRISFSCILGPKSRTWRDLLRLKRIGRI